jgi:adenylate cyclase class 2
MKPEIEVKFLNIDIADMRRRLSEAGAHLEQPMRLMKRALIEEPHHREQHAFIRIRDEGDKTTLTFKRRDDQAASTIDSVKEIEVVVSDFNTTVELFQEAGWQYKTLQESKRETWQLNDCEVVIDEWPWIAPYIEIEGPTEESVKSVARTLAFDWNKVVIGHIDAVYELEYDFAPGFRGVIDVKEVKFDQPLPDQFKEKK